MFDSVFGELKQDDEYVVGTIRLRFHEEEKNADIQICLGDETEIKKIQYEAFCEFMKNWNVLQIDIAEQILKFYNESEKGAWGPDDKEQFRLWWPEIENAKELASYIHIDAIVIPEVFIMGTERRVYVLFDRDWGGHDGDDNGVAVKLVNEKITEIGYKDMAY